MIMEEDAVKRLALVLSVQAEIDGMKAHNEVCPNNPYMKKDFDAKAEELRGLSYAHNQQLFG